MHIYQLKYEIRVVTILKLLDYCIRIVMTATTQIWFFVICYTTELRCRYVSCHNFLINYLLLLAMTPESLAIPQANSLKHCIIR